MNVILLMIVCLGVISYLLLGREKFVKMLFFLGKGLLNFLLSLLKALLVVIKSSISFIISGRRSGNFRFKQTVNIIKPNRGNHIYEINGDFYDYGGIAKISELNYSTVLGLPLGKYCDLSSSPKSLLSMHIDELSKGCLIIGPPGSGKTFGVLLPWTISLLKSGQSVVLLDVKGDLSKSFNDPSIKKYCRVLHWGIGMVNSIAWNWLLHIKQASDIEACCRSILGDSPKDDHNLFFYERDYRWLRSLLKIVVQVYQHLATPDILWKLLNNQNEIIKLSRNTNAQKSGVLNELNDLCSFPSGEYSLAVSGLLNKLVIFNDPDIRRISNTNNFHIDELKKQPTLLIIGAAISDGRRSLILSSIILNLILNSEVYSGYQNQHKININFLIDEAARLQGRFPVTEVLSIIRGSNNGVALIYQDLAQIGNTEKINEIIAMAHTTIALRNVSKFSANLLSERFGLRSIRVANYSKMRESFDFFSKATTRTITHQKVPVLGEREIMYPPDICGKYCAVIHNRNMSSKPFLVSFE